MSNALLPARSQSAATSNTTRTIVFIDANVSDYESLVADIAANTKEIETILLEPSRNGV